MTLAQDSHSRFLLEQYDGFVSYMKGLLPLIEAQRAGGFYA